MSGAPGRSPVCDVPLSQSSNDARAYAEMICCHACVRVCVYSASHWHGVRACDGAGDVHIDARLVCVPTAGSGGNDRGSHDLKV